MDDNPFHRYRLELLHKREVHRQQRRAAKLARLQAKESQRNQRLLEGRLSLSDRFKEWKRRRQLKKEREVEWLREKTDYHPFFLWLREGETKFFLLGAIVLIGAFGYLLYLKQLHIRLLYKRLAGSQTVLVRVGDEEIRTGAFEKRLWTRHAEREIQLETLLLLLQQATEKIDLDANQYRTLEDEIRLEHSMTLAEEVDFTEEKYTLSHVSQADKQKLFDERRDELPVYHLSSVHFKDSASAEEFVRAFLKGMTPERAAETYSMDERPVRLKPIMAGELDERLGVLQAREVRSLERGRYSSPLPTEDGHFVIYRIDRVDSQFQEVLPAINSVFVDLRRQEARKRLVEQSTIETSQFTKEQIIELKL